MLTNLHNHHAVRKVTGEQQVTIINQLDTPGHVNNKPGVSIINQRLLDVSCTWQWCHGGKSSVLDKVP